MKIQSQIKLTPLQMGNETFKDLAKTSAKDKLKEEIFKMLEPFIEETTEGDKATFSINYSETIEMAVLGNEPSKIRVLKIFHE